jgi:hypothetical protein
MMLLLVSTCTRGVALLALAATGVGTEGTLEQSPGI